MARAVLLLLLTGDFASGAGGPAPLFAGDEALSITITAPLESFVRDRSDEEELAATIQWTDIDGQTKSVEIEMQARGNSRRDPRVCPFPPVRLDFRKSDVRGTLFDGQDKLKMVTHCRNKSYRSAQNVLREYLAYRILNSVTELSYRVRLLNVTWVNNEDGDATMDTVGFVIESNDRLAERIGMDKAELVSTSVDRLDPDATNLVSVFQYLIGNTDFSPIAGPEGQGCCHNIALFGQPAGTLYPVPYDFDMSGFVDADYAMPNPRLHIKSVKTRVYRGRCQFNARLDVTAATFVAKRDTIFGLLDSLADLDRKSRRPMRRYIDEFYAMIGDPDARAQRLAENCVN